MRSFAFLALVLASLATAACAAATIPKTGVRGIVLRGPTQPVCQVGRTCEGPAAAVTLVFSRAGTERARVKTGHDGRFTVALAPGRYGVRTTAKVFGRTPQPATVTVPRTGYARVTLRIDTGIR